MKSSPRLITGALAVVALVASSGCDLLTAPSDQPVVISVETVTELPPIGPVGTGTQTGAGAQADDSIPYPQDRFVGAKKKNPGSLDETRYLD